MENIDFFEQQSDLTAAKIKIYKDYIESYLPKILMTFDKCYIADLFCGPGKNEGSPLILIKKINYILTSPKLKEKNKLKINVLFNDKEKKHTNSLKKELQNINTNSEIVKIDVDTKEYKNVLSNILKDLRNTSFPKFFFLDPFNYSDIKMNDLKKLMSLSRSEVLLFNPLFHSYRFSNSNFDKNHKTRIFLKEFTTRGVANYKNVDEYLMSIKEKIQIETNIEYVRPVLLDAGNRMNALFLLTKHQSGMLLMDKIALKHTEDGSRYKINSKKQVSLFSKIETSSLYNNFKKDLINKIKTKGKMTNKQISTFAIENYFLPRYAKDIIKEYVRNFNKIDVFDENNNKITDMRKWNIAEKITKTTYFKWKNNE